VRQYRVERRWSQAELASRISDLGHGWHQTTVAKTERAERDPRYPELIALAEALAVPLEALLGIASEPASDAANESLYTIHRLEQEGQLLMQRVAFLTHDIDDMETQRKEHLQRLSELKKEIAAARRAYKAAGT
jgi:transcriptional regulator with XRE-family HTH domain